VQKQFSFDFEFKNSFFLYVQKLCKKRGCDGGGGGVGGGGRKEEIRKRREEKIQKKI